MLQMTVFDQRHQIPYSHPSGRKLGHESYGSIGTFQEHFEAGCLLIYKVAEGDMCRCTIHSTGGKRGNKWERARVVNDQFEVDGHRGHNSAAKAGNVAEGVISFYAGGCEEENEGERSNKQSYDQRKLTHDRCEEVSQWLAMR